MDTIVIDREKPGDVFAREALLDRVMGPIRFRRSSERLREGRMPSEGLSLAARKGDGTLVGTVRLWDAKASDLRDAVLLGPLAVDPGLQGHGVGSHLMVAAIDAARIAGRSAIILVGDPGYYARFGFSGEVMTRYFMPGPFERHRLLGLELKPGALASGHGTLRAAGRRNGEQPKRLRAVA